MGSQPFGGEGLSGTGLKAGGPFYVNRFRRTEPPVEHPATSGPEIDRTGLQAAVLGLDTRNWAARPDRASMLRRALSGRGGLIRRALSAVAAFDPGPFTLPGPTGESKRLSLRPRGPILCLVPTGRLRWRRRCKLSARAAAR